MSVALQGMQSLAQRIWSKAAGEVLGWAPDSQAIVLDAENHLIEALSATAASAKTARG